MRYDEHSVRILRDDKGLILHVDPQKLQELRKLLARGLNTWERAPKWLLKLAEAAE